MHGADRQGRPVPRERSLRIGINGFGRMGRLLYAPAGGRPDRFGSCSQRPERIAPRRARTCSSFDSVHGRWPRQIAAVTARSQSTARRSHADAKRAVRGASRGVGSAPTSVRTVRAAFFSDTRYARPFVGAGRLEVVVAAPVQARRRGLNVVLGVNYER